MRYPDLHVSPSTRRLLARAAFLAPATFLLVAAFERRWMDDDGFINLRVVRNLLHGAGPVFNVDERVEAVTSPLWIGILAALGALGIRLEYAAVFAGIALTLGAVLLAQRAASRLEPASTPEGDRPWNIPLPVGMAIFVALPATWDYASSGLETGLGLAWLAACYAVMVARIRVDAQSPRSLRSDALASALVGLGPLIRPELALYAIAPLGILAWTSAMRGGSGWPSRAFAVAVVGLSACAVPVAYEIFRMGYYGSVVPNTAIAKEAFLSRYEQGRCYFNNFFGTYTMGWPLFGAGVFWAARVHGFAGRPERPRLQLVGVLAPPIAALVHIGYVVRIGGDYMHARMFLPALFAALMPIAVIPPTLPTLAAHKYGKTLTWIAAAVILGWLPVCVAWLRVGVENVCGIGDERGWYARLAKVDHPVLLGSYAKHEFYDGAVKVEKQVIDECSHGKGAGIRRGAGCRILVLDEAEQKDLGPTAVSYPLAESIDGRIDAVFSDGAIGISGYLLPSSVHLIDRHGLADPLVAHATLVDRGRPGHEKTLPAAWTVARFTPAAALEDAAVVAARHALQCGPLAELERAGQGPMTVDAFFDNVKHAWGNGKLRIPRDPFAAEARFCGGSLPPDVSAGGKGGKPFRWQCPAGLAVTRVVGTFDTKEKAIAGVVARCERPGPDPERVVGPKFGEGKEGAFEAACPAGQTEIGIHGHADRLIRSFGGICSGPEGPAYTAEGGNTTGEPFELKCPEGTVLRGVTGRSGALVDNVGILCGDPGHDGEGPAAPAR